MNATIPDSIKALGAPAVAQYLLLASPFGTLLNEPTMRNAIAEEEVLRRIEAYVYEPDWLMGEETAIANWAKVRPEAAQHAESSAAALDCTGYSEDAAKVRRLLRVSAIRRLDMSLSQISETHSFMPELGGSSLHRSPVKVGAKVVVLNLSRPSGISQNVPPGIPALPSALKDEELVGGAETAIMPTAALPPEDFSRYVENRKLAQPFREYEEVNKLPSFPRMTYPPPLVVPPGYTKRFEDEYLEAQQVTAAEVLALGIAIFVSAPGLSYLATRQDEIKAIVDDPAFPLRQMETWLMQDLSSITEPK